VKFWWCVECRAVDCFVSATHSCTQSPLNPAIQLSTQLILKSSPLSSKHSVRALSLSHDVECAEVQRTLCRVVARCSCVRAAESKASRYRHAGDKVKKSIASTHSWLGTTWDEWWASRSGRALPREDLRYSLDRRTLCWLNYPSYAREAEGHVQTHNCWPLWEMVFLLFIHPVDLVCFVFWSCHS
jgi:hypothetical protein